MPKPITRADQNAETRRRLLGSARRLFLRKGFHATSLADVAADAGYTKGAVFSQFESKADLFLALLEQRSAERIARLETMTSDRADADALVGWLAKDWSDNEGDLSAWSLLVIEFRVHAARDRNVARRYARLHARLCQVLADQYQRHLSAAGLTATLGFDELARAGLAIGHGLLLEHVARPDFDAVRVVEALVRGLIRN